MSNQGMDLKNVAKKWQAIWRKEKVFKSKEVKKKKYYCLEMFPYPSGKMHMGHVRNYSIGDAFARFKRMNGFSVLYPMGWDAFGLPAENAAIKNNAKPDEWTKKCIQQMKKQLMQLGLSYDWDREITTCDPAYYIWNQWLFQKMFEKGLAYRKKSTVNWCDDCGTVLANEQVEQGKCWRCENPVSVKELEQWFLKITQYADELLKDIDTLEHWPNSVKIMQRNWIGKSKGTMISFPLANENKSLDVFTTRPDTLFGCTFLVVAPENPLTLELVKGSDYEDKTKRFIAKSVQDKEGKEKRGIFLGKYAINPATQEKIPIYAANFVLMEYGTGAVMSVPAHDQRDYEFAKKYNIPVKTVIQGKEHVKDKAYVGEGVLVNSGPFNGMHNVEAMKQITAWLTKEGKGRETTQYKLRDWLISRQRYWGTPIPIIFCNTCGIVPAPLPVKLPTSVQFTGKGNPLDVDSFKKTTCPKCKKEAERETDTMDTFFDSSWYYLRFCDPTNKKKPFAEKKVSYWMPIDQYIGGIEHAILHLLYARFFFKVLRDMGMVKGNEPFTRLLSQGMVTFKGAKMSKSKGNIVDPSTIIDRFGPDTARTFILFASAPEKELDWSDDGVEASHRFLQRAASLVTLVGGDGSKDKHLQSKMQQTIHQVTTRLERFGMNAALQSIMEATNFILLHKDRISKKKLKQSLRIYYALLSPFAPHVSEECWEKLGNKTLVSLSRWPKYDARLVNPTFDAADTLVAQMSADISKVIELTKIQPKKVTLFIAAQWKRELYTQLNKLMKKTRNVGDILKQLMRGELKEHGQHVSKLVPVLVKNPQRIPDIIFSQKEEKNIMSLFGEGKSFEVIIELEEQATLDKAKQALPGKPAFLVE